MDKYNGPERRVEQRRTKPRRELIRFEIDKPDRRARTDRRSHPGVWSGGHTSY